MITLSPHPTQPDVIQGFNEAGDLILHGKYVLGVGPHAPAEGFMLPVQFVVTKKIDPRNVPAN